MLQNYSFFSIIQKNKIIFVILLPFPHPCELSRSVRNWELSLFQISFVSLPAYFGSPLSCKYALQKQTSLLWFCSYTHTHTHIHISIFVQLISLHWWIQFSPRVFLQGDFFSIMILSSYIHIIVSLLWFSFSIFAQT